MSGPADLAAPRRRGPFTRWPRAADATLAAVMLLLTVHLVDGPGDAIAFRPVTAVPLPVLAVFVVGAAALYWRRREPLAVLATVLLCWASTLASDYSDVGGYATVAVYSVGRYTADERVRWGFAGLAATIGVLAVDGLDGLTPLADWLVGAVFMSGAWYIGRRIRLRRRRAAELLRERAAEERRILAEERTRIARELHDVVAHQVSLMTVQAGAAKAVAAKDPAAAQRAMAAVEDAGRQALGELRHLLGVLRPEPETGGGLSPQPGLRDVPLLVEHVRAAGVDVSLAAEQPGAALPARVDLFAFRIVQEALTNVLKHGGRGAHAHVRVAVEGDELVLEVRDDGGVGSGVATPSSGGAVHDGSSGHGLVGMTERVLLLGGHLDVGPCAGGGYGVLARLPIGGEPT